MGWQSYRRRAQFAALAAVFAIPLLASCGDSASGGLPPDIAKSVSTSGDLWIDFPFNGRCPNDPQNWVGYAGLYVKGSQEAFPSMQGNNLIESEHPPLATFSRDGSQALLAAFIADMVHGGLASYAQGYNLFGTYYCIKLNPSPLGNLLYTGYRDTAGNVTRGVVLTGDFAYDGAEFVSDFDKLRASGITAKHRKFHLLAHVTERTAIGTHIFKLQRDLVIFFNPENNAWEIDPTDGTGWAVSAQ